MISAGSLTERITLQVKSVTRNSIGEEVVSWQTLAEVWALAAPLRGREFYAAAQLQAASDTRFVLYARSDVTTDNRILWRGTPYDIRHVAAVMPERQFVEILAETGVHDGR